MAATGMTSTKTAQDMPEVQNLNWSGAASGDNYVDIYRSRSKPYVRILMDNGVTGIDLESNLDLIRRTVAAVEDLDAFAVLQTHK